MKKIFLFLIIVMLMTTGCKNKEEDEKSQYLAMKSDLFHNKNYTNIDDIKCDVVFKLDRVDEEKVSYSVVFSNPKENMNNIKAMLVHNYYTEDIFPTLGLFNKKKSLLVKSADEDKNKIELSGIIETTDDIDKIDLEVKVLVQYVTDDGEKKDIYYKAT